MQIILNCAWNWNSSKFQSIEVVLEILKGLEYFYYFIFFLLGQFYFACENGSQTKFKAIPDQTLSVLHVAWTVEVYSNSFSKHQDRFLSINCSWEPNRWVENAIVQLNIVSYWGIHMNSLNC